MECGFADRMETLGRMVRARVRGEEPEGTDLACRLNVQAPKDSAVERGLDRGSTLVNLLTTDSLLGTLLAPLSIAGGAWSLARAQNVPGRIAHFKIPRHIKFVSDFPMTISGKVQKFRMREISVVELGINHH